MRGGGDCTSDVDCYNATTSTVINSNLCIENKCHCDMRHTGSHCKGSYGYDDVTYDDNIDILYSGHRPPLRIDSAVMGAVTLCVVSLSSIILCMYIYKPV